MLTISNSLLANYFKRVYFPFTTLFDAQLGMNSSPLQKGIIWVRSLIKAESGYRIDNRCNVKIWEDNWIHGKTHFSPVVKTVQGEHFSYVLELILSDMQWKKDLIHQVFMPIDIEKILAIPLSHTACVDKLVWFASLDGKFSVKKAYWFTCELQKLSEPLSSNSNALRKLWKLIWTTIVPSKLSFGHSIPLQTEFLQKFTCAKEVFQLNTLSCLF